MTKIIAHRGYSARYPENTVLAFEKALEAGADAIELDVHFTKDSQLIVYHNNYTDDDKRVSELTRDELQLPILGDVFMEFGQNINYEIELKGFTVPFLESVLHSPLGLLDKDFIAQSYERGLKIHAADCNSEEELMRAFELKVDQLSTNEVELAIRLRE